MVADNRFGSTELASIAEAYETLGHELAQMGDGDRRRVCGVIVAAIARTSPVAVADIAAASAFTVLTAGGAK